MAGPTVTLNFVGNSAGLRRTINEALVGIGAISSAGIAGGAALAAVPLGFAAMGIAAVAETEKVKSAFTGLKDHVVTQTRLLAAPFEGTLVGIAEKARATFDRIGPSLGRIFEMSAPMVDRLATAVLNLVEGAMPGFETATRAATPLINALALGIESLAPRINEFFAILATHTPAFQAAITALFQVLGQMLPVIANILGVLAQWSAILIPLLPVILGIVVAVRVLTTVVNTVIAVIRGVTLVWGLLNAVMLANPFVLIAALIAALVAALIYAWNNSEKFRSIVIGVWNAVKTAITVAVNGIKAALNWFSQLPGMVSNWFQRAKDAAVQRIMALVAAVRALPGQIRSALGNLGSLLVSAGRDVVNGLWRGIQAGWNWLIGSVRNLASSLLRAAKSALGIGSPSKLFRDEVGKWIPEGMAQGIERNLRVVRNAAQRMGSASVPEVIPTMGRRSGATSGAQTIVNVHVAGSIRSDKDLVGLIRNEMLRGGFRGARTGAL